MNTEAQIDHMKAAWHAAITTRDLPSLMALYHEDAVIESSAVLVIEKDTGGTLRGKPALTRHFAAFFEIVGKDAPNWWRYEPHSDGDLLAWEYPSASLEGEPQLDVVESFTLQDGLISTHRVYWGWRGFQLLMAVDQ